MVKLVLLFSIILIGIFISESDSFRSLETRRRTYVYLIISILILLSGMRNWAVGSDTYQYYYIFEIVKQDSWENLLNSLIQYEGKDPFYRVFLKAFQVFSLNYQVFLILVAVLFMTALGNFILKNTSKIRHAVIAFVVYIGYFYGFFSITGTRQTISTAFLLWSFEYVKRKKYIQFILLVLIAGLFHISALVFLLLVFVANFKKPKQLFFLVLISFPIIFYYKNNLAVFFVVSTGMENRFGIFAEQFHRGGSLILTIFHVILGLISLLTYQNVIKMRPEGFRFYNLFAMALFFFPLQWVNPSAGRIAQYFDVIIIVLIPYLLDALAGRCIYDRKIVYSLTVILFVVLTTFTITTWDEYKFFWQFMPVPY